MKTVIITGGSKGIGADIARDFLNTNYKVLIGARHRSGLAKEKHDNLQFMKIDVRVESEHHDLINKALDWNNNFICYINCAGLSNWSPIENIDNKFLDKFPLIQNFFEEMSRFKPFIELDEYKDIIS